LRPFVAADAPAVQRLANNRNIADTTLNIPHPYDISAAEEWIATHAEKWQARELMVFAVLDNASTDLLGACGLTINERFERAEIGYWIGEPYWGHGYCTEAAELVLKYGFEELHLHRIHGSYLARNPASGRVMQKIGMQYEGTARDHTKKWDVFEDLVLYGLLRDEWCNRQQREG
jgi:RimJ/RimL family protein N-acetyltransferase